MAPQLTVTKGFPARSPDPWIARAFPPARPRSGVEGDAKILRFLERHDFPAERLAVDDAVSDFGGSSLLVTRFVESRPFPNVATKLGMMGDLLGRLHALPFDESIDRPGGASGEDPAHEGRPRQVAVAHRGGWATLLRVPSTTS